MAQMSIDTSSVSSICSSYKSKISSIDLGGIDVAGAFEPLTSVGVLTSYVPSLKEALSSITENCSSICSLLENLVSTQTAIDNNAASAADTGSFGNYGNYSGSTGGSYGGSTGGSTSSGGQQSTTVDSGQQTISIDAPSDDTQLQQLTTDDGFMQSLLSIAKTTPTAITSEERASFLKELLKIKNQKSTGTLEIIESTDPDVLQAYLKKILNGELPITDISQSITFDILEQIAKEKNIELSELITTDNMEDIKAKVQEMADEYITLFSSNDLTTELLSVYDGASLDKYSEEFTTSIRTALDMIALNKDITSETLLSDDQYSGYLNEQLTKVIGDLNEVKAVATQGNDAFVSTITKLISENAEAFSGTTTITDTSTTTTGSDAIVPEVTETELTHDVDVPGAVPLA